MAQTHKRTRTSVHLLNYHFVWITRRRKKALVGEIAERAAALIQEAAEGLGCEALALEVMPDHVHLFLNASPDLAPTQLMHRIKGTTARQLRKEFPHLTRMPSMWTRSYFVSTAGNVSSQTIKRYIEEQQTT